MGHAHGLIDDSIKRSREGVRTVLLALVVLALTAGVQAVVLGASGSVALLADLIHNVGDALTAVPLGVAFALRSPRAERWAGLALGALAATGFVGFVGNWAAAGIRTRGGHRLDSPTTRGRHSH